MGSKGVLIVYVDPSNRPAGLGVALTPEDLDRHLEQAQYNITLANCAVELYDVASAGETYRLPPGAGVEQVLEAIFGQQ